MSEEEKIETSPEIPIEWHISDSIVARYATNMAVQHTDREIILSFFEIIPPLIFTSQDQEVLQSLKSIRANCVARIIVSPERMQKFIDVLQENLDRHLAKMKETSE